MDDFLNALRFMTRIPVPGSRLAAHANSPAQVPWYAMVGLVIGIILSAWSWLLGGVPPMLQAALVLAAWVWITGALHLDGLADCGDAWMSGQSGSRFLEILRDTRCGAGALVWVALVLLVKFAALAVLLGFGQWAALVFAPVLARIAVQVAILRCRYVRSDGLGANKSLIRRGRSNRHCWRCPSRPIPSFSERRAGGSRCSRSTSLLVCARATGST